LTEKSVQIVLHLFSKPAWEFEELEQGELDEKFSEKIRNKADELKQWLYEVAGIHETLVKNGWIAIGTLYNIIYHKDVSIEEAKKELRKLGLEKLTDNLEELDFEEFEGELDEECNGLGD